MGFGEELEINALTAPSKLSGYTKFDYTGLLLVQYHLGNDSPKGEDELTSITIKSPLDINRSGFLLNDGILRIAGSMETNIELLLPINYVPESSVEAEVADWTYFALLQEKTFISTDQDYYYPGETIWFSAVMNYRTPSLRDSLSQVLYVELLDVHHQTIVNKTLRISQGIGQGEFNLPDTLTPSTYYLRAYTNWMRNYGDSLLFTRPVPVLDYSKSLTYAEHPSHKSTNRLTIELETDKVNYQAEEDVSFSLHIKDTLGNLVDGRFSISVIDLESSARIPALNKIQDAVDFSPIEERYREGYFDKIRNHLERGLSFSGQIKNIKGNNTHANLEIIQQQIGYLVSMETDENGQFSVINLNFLHSLFFSIKPRDAKGKPLNFVTLIPKSTPSFYYAGPSIQLDYPREVAPRIRLLYQENQETKLLDDVIVTGKKIDPQ